MDVRDRIREVATECLKRTDSWDAAAVVMRKMLDADPELCRVLMEPMIDAAAWAAIRSAARAQGIPYATVSRPDAAANIMAVGAVNRAGAQPPPR
jgi:hypothetical protein